MAEAEDVRRRATGLVEAIRPHPHRGDLIAAGAVPLTLGVLLVDLRMADPWGTGVLLVLTAAAAAIVLGMGLLAPAEGERPRAYLQVLLLCGLLLLLLALRLLAEALGAEEDSAATLTWTFGAVAATAAWLARERRSAVCALVAAGAGAVALLAFVEWVFDPDGLGAFRWILLALAIGLVLAALSLRDRRRPESVYLIDAAGLAVLAIGVSYLVPLLLALFFAHEIPGGGWKAILLAAGLGSVAYAAVDREPGPAYVGVANLLVFALLVGTPWTDEPSLFLWPLLLLLAGGAMVAAGLRPRRELPPEPAVPGEHPTEPLPGPGSRLWTREP